ncbi:hypothetical protein GGR28_001477 [Lewinella aquimaris]|uniref:YdhG-like domain-containing protein n=1 Tax=Neolewinella aquimaris TaxID=1835722 RepID=A0A840E162_9BACT|nr:DUF1801 domain-containing protein [Neolewinella aquimaris]MBB4078860.1 hypothetical protein [Neolewinella aquimaris]
MATNKTQPTQQSVAEFIEGIPDPDKRADSQAIIDLMTEVTGEPPVMWGDSIVGFGTYHYVYASGREGDWMEVGFSPRKNDLTVYLMGGIKGETELLAKLGKHKTGKSCLYLKRLTEVDVDILRLLVESTVARVRKGNIAY